MLHGTMTRRPGVQARCSTRQSSRAGQMFTTVQCGEQFTVSVAARDHSRSPHAPCSGGSGRLFRGRYRPAEKAALGLPSRSASGAPAACGFARSAPRRGRAPRERLFKHGTKLAERVEALKALEADRRMRAEYVRVLAERDRLTEEMERMADPIAQIAHTVSRIEICDREIRRLNATSAAKFGHIPLVLLGAAPAVAALFRDVIVRDVFMEVAGLQSAARQPISHFATDALGEVERARNDHPGRSTSCSWDMLGIEMPREIETQRAAVASASRSRPDAWGELAGRPRATETS